MRSRHLAICCALLALAGGSACAVNLPGEGEARCTVQGGEKLPAGSGGVEALCAEIDAATANLPERPAVTVRVEAAQVLAARVTIDGRTLPEIKMARSDRALDRLAFRRFAQAIAAASTASAER